MTIINSGDGSPKGHIARGDEFYSAGNNRLALREYELAYKEQPSGYEELLRLVRIFNDLGRIALSHSDSSELFYRRSTAFADSLQHYYPQKAETQFMYALAYGSLIPFSGVHEKIRIGKVVRDHARRTMEIDSTFPMTYVVLGIFEREGANLSWIARAIVRIVFGESIDGSLSQSESFLREALRLDPANSYALYELYWTYRAMGDSTRAIEALRCVMQISPRNARESSQLDEARTELEKMGSQSR